jgi:hypothetical protein
MNKMLRLAGLVGALAMSFMAKPGYAIVDCATRDGYACTQQNAFSRCYDYSQGELYPCWCDHASGPLLWRCGPNSCSVDPGSCHLGS